MFFNPLQSVFSFIFISRVSLISKITERIAVSIFTPTKLNHIPSSPKLQSAPRSSMGKTNAVATDITVASRGLPMALK